MAFLCHTVYTAAGESLAKSCNTEKLMSRVFNNISKLGALETVCGWHSFYLKLETVLSAPEDSRHKFVILKRHLSQ